MAEQDGVEEEREMEAQEMDEEDALLRFSRYSEERAAVPWDQRTFREKVGYHLDRFFLAFLFLFFLVMMGEAVYKVWYIMNVRKLQQFAVDVFSFFLRQEEEEELMEL